MKLICFIRSGGCVSDVIHEEWLQKDEAHQTVRLLRFYECRHCKETWATITSPELEETRHAKPEPYVYPGKPATA